MPGPSLVPFSNFLDSLGKAANETQKRHLFTELAARGFEDDRLATSLALGAEYKVHFAQAGLLRRGSVDSYYGSLIIEFENDLRKSGEHALEQLQAYVAGAWREDGSTDRQYLAVATDGSIWRTFIPRANVHLDHLEPEQVLLSPVEEWKLSGSDDAASLRDFLNRLFYRKDPIKPTAGNFARDFGRNSPAYQAATDLLRRKYEEVKDTPQLAVLQKIWSKSLQLVYGSDEATRNFSFDISASCGTWRMWPHYLTCHPVLRLPQRPHPAKMSGFLDENSRDGYPQRTSLGM